MPAYSFGSLPNVVSISSMRSVGCSDSIMRNRVASVCPVHLRGLRTTSWAASNKRVFPHSRDGEETSRYGEQSDASTAHVCSTHSPIASAWSSLITTNRRIWAMTFSRSEPVSATPITPRTA